MTIPITDSCRNCDKILASFSQRFGCRECFERVRAAEDAAVASSTGGPAKPPLPAVGLRYQHEYRAPDETEWKKDGLEREVVAVRVDCGTFYWKTRGSWFPIEGGDDLHIWTSNTFSIDSGHRPLLGRIVLVTP